MGKKLLKIISIVSVVFLGCTRYAPGEWVNDFPNALFTARGCETQRISFGGYITAAYRWVETKDELTGPNYGEGLNFGGEHTDPKPFNNFFLRDIRLFVRAELCDYWTGFMSIDFTGRSVDLECIERLPIFIDRIYIQKQWADSTQFRAGYQKVNFGAEESISLERLKTVERSLVTRFFRNLGRRAVDGIYIPGTGSVIFGGNRFADRHVGLFLTGDLGSFKYNVAIVNGYQGICRNSTVFDNELGYFAGLAYEASMCEVDVRMGINAGYKPKGGSWAEKSGDCVTGRVNNSSVWGLNPYIMGNWNCLTILAEFLYGSVEEGQLTAGRSTANPFGFIFIPSYMLSDCWELVGRLSYLNTNKMGTTIQDSFGAAPDSGDTAEHPGGNCRDNTFISSEVQFEKATALYVGVNYYTVNQAVKATLGYEYAKFRNAFIGQIGVGAFNDQKAIVNAVRAQLQISF